MECGVWWSVKCGGRGVTGTEPVPFFPKRHVFFREPRAEEWSGEREVGGGERERERAGGRDRRVRHRGCGGSSCYCCGLGKGAPRCASLVMKDDGL